MFKKLGILGALSELLEPHLFGRTGAFKFGTIGVHLCGDLFLHHTMLTTLDLLQYNNPSPRGPLYKYV